MDDEGVDCTARQVEEFRASDEQGAVAKYLSDGRGTITRTSSLRITTLDGGRGLCSLAVPLEMWVGNDAPALNTTHLAGLVFLLRDAIGNQASMHTGAGLAQWEGLRGLF